MKTIKKLIVLICGIPLLFTSCSSDDNNSTGNVSGDYSNGIFILNEGKFMTDNTADVSFLSTDGTLENDIFYGVNNSHLGDTAQSMGFEGDRAYIIVNNSNVIKVVNRHNFELITTITTGIQSPRYIVFESGKGYVSNLGNPAETSDDFIAVIDLNSNQVTTTIPVTEGPEKMIKKDGKLYVAHKGGWGIGKTISVIDLSTHSVITTITVTDFPDGIQEKNGYLYVLCQGLTSWTETPSSQGTLYKIDLNNNQIVSALSFPEGVHPSHLEIEDNKLYYTINNGVYAMDLSASTLPTDAIITLNGVFSIYGFEVKDGKIYMSDPKDYNSNGEIFIYSTNGTLINSYEVGIVPNGFYFTN